MALVFWQHGLSASLTAFSLLGRCCPFIPLFSTSSMFHAALTSRSQELAWHRLLVQRDTFQLLLRTILVTLSFRIHRLQLQSI